MVKWGVFTWVCFYDNIKKWRFMNYGNKNDKNFYILYLGTIFLLLVLCAKIVSLLYKGEMNMGHSEYRKRNKEWDDIKCKENRMLNYMMMRYLLGRKKKFINPFINDDGSVMLNRAKLDKIIHKRSSYISVEDAKAWALKLNMSEGIFSGTERFKFPENEKYPLLNDNKWEQFTLYMDRVNRAEPNYINGEEQDIFNAINAFVDEIKMYLNDVLNMNININDDQLRRYVFYIKHGSMYLDDNTYNMCNELIDKMKSLTINDIAKLNNESLVNYKSELKRQIEKVNAIIICREDGVFVKK